MSLSQASNDTLDQIFDNASGFHATNLMGDGNWTLSVSVHVPEGDDYVESVQDPDLNAGLAALKERLDSHQG
jgi:hypothetical protein